MGSLGDNFARFNQTQQICDLSVRIELKKVLRAKHSISSNLGVPPPFPGKK